jgi:hypothetical protein
VARGARSDAFISTRQFGNALTTWCDNPMVPSGRIFSWSQAIQAGQVTVEDHLMSDLDIQPLLVVGWEGLIGSLVMLGCALPLLQHLPYRDGSGFAEDTIGSFCMIRNSRAISGVCCLPGCLLLPLADPTCIHYVLMMNDV